MKNAKEIARDVMPFHVPNEFLPLIEKAVIAGLEVAAKVADGLDVADETPYDEAMSISMHAMSIAAAIRKLKGE